jgi:hypothetical protein
VSYEYPGDLPEHRWETCPVFGGCDDCRSSKFEKNSPDVAFPTALDIEDDTPHPKYKIHEPERHQVVGWDDENLSQFEEGIGAIVAHNIEVEQIRTAKQEAARAWTVEAADDVEDARVAANNSFYTPAAFNAAVNETLDRAREVSDTRGLEYGDTWALANQFTPFSDSVENLDDPLVRGWHRVAEQSVELKRLKLIAGLIDVKISRMRGPWKADTVEDLINYLAAFRTWRDEFEIGKF